MTQTPEIVKINIDGQDVEFSVQKRDFVRLRVKASGFGYKGYKNLNVECTVFFDRNCSAMVSPDFFAYDFVSQDSYEILSHSAKTELLAKISEVIKPFAESKIDREVFAAYLAQQ